MINLFPKIISKCCAYFLIFASSLSSAKSDLAMVYELALSNDPNIKASKANYLANSEIKIKQDHYYYQIYKQMQVIQKQTKKVKVGDTTLPLLLS